MVHITGEDRIRLLSTLAVEIFKALPEEPTLDTRINAASKLQATHAMNIAWLILEDATDRTNGGSR